MATFDKDGTYIESPDLKLGYVTSQTAELTWTYIVENEEIGHYETITEYPNGGKDVEWVVDTPGKGYWESRNADGNVVEHYDGDEQPDESWDKDTVVVTYWEYGLYTPYTEEELARKEAEEAEVERLSQIEDYKAKLASTDYVLTKMVEYNVSNTVMPEEDAARYADIIKQREEWRAEINRLESEVVENA